MTSIPLPMTTALLMLLLYGTSAAAQDDQLASLDTKHMLERSIVNPGKQSRLQMVMAKARRGEAITIGVIGGSITQGASAGKAENRYANKVHAWWSQKFQQSKVTLVNAGVGGTSSRWGVFRAPNDLLKHKPDFVIVEFSVNDSSLQEQSLPYYEGLTRQILQQANQPALLLLFMMNIHKGKAGSNVQEHHSRIGTHYQLPMISFRDAVYPEMEAKRLEWKDMLADRVHPNSQGHAFAARCITEFLSGVAAKLPDDSTIPAVDAIPAPLITAAYESTDLLRMHKVKLLNQQGWTEKRFFGFPGWTASEPGSSISFRVKGSSIYLMAPWGKTFGNMSVTVNDGEPILITNNKNTKFKQVRGQYRIADNLPLGLHTVSIRITDKTPSIASTECGIFGFGVTLAAQAATTP